MRPRNKSERHTIAKNKQKNRVKKIHGKGTYEDFLNDTLVNTNLHCYKETGNPCSCYMCSSEKYKRSREISRIKEEMDNTE